MKLVSKIFQWLLWRPEIQEPEKPPKTIEDKNLEDALRLVRRIKQIQEQVRQWGRANKRWASFDDPWPMPHSDAQKRELREWRDKEVRAHEALRLWFGSGKTFNAPLHPELKGFVQ